MPSPSYHVEPIVSLPFEEVSYVIHLADHPQCLVIDPGFEPGRIIRYIEAHELQPAAILNTHGHCDHIAGNRAMKERWPEAPLIIGKGDSRMLSDPLWNLSASMGTLAVTSPPADRLLEEGDTFEAAGIALEVLEVPGHTPGHIVFLWSQSQPAVVFGGDVLFAGSIGRVDLPYGNPQQLLQGIRQKLFRLPDETVVYPGHGPPTTVGEERRTNPFVGDHATVW